MPRRADPSTRASAPPSRPAGSARANRRRRNAEPDPLGHDTVVLARPSDAEAGGADPGSETGAEHAAETDAEPASRTGPEIGPETQDETKARGPSDRSAARPGPAAHSESAQGGTLRLPPIVAGAAAAAWSALIGLSLTGLAVVLAWVAAPHDETPWATTLRAAGAAWLSAHHVPLLLDGVPLTLTPWGLLLAPALLLVLTARWAVRVSRAGDAGAVGMLVLGAAGTYGVAGAGVALAVGGAELTVLTTEAAVLTAAVAAAVVATTALRRTGVGRALWARVPAVGRHVTAAAGVGLATLVGAAALLTAVALLTGAGRRSALTDALDPGTAGGPLLLLLCLAYLPVVVVWALAFLTGPGVALGADTLVGPFAVSVGDLPAFPLLSVVPERPHWWFAALLAVPVVAGGVAALVLVRRGGHGMHGSTPDSGVLVGSVAGVALAVGAAVALLCSLASGALGAGRLADLGPAPLATGAAAAGLVGLGCLLGTLVLTIRPPRDRTGEAVAPGS